MEIQRDKLRNSNKVKVTRGLFLETSVSPENILYTLRQEDYLGYPSLYKLFIESCTVDLSEYQFSLSYFWDYGHWQTVSKASWIKDYLVVWRDEVAVILESRYLARMEALAAKGGKEAFTCNRYLLERLEKVGGASKRGRPTKGSSRQEIERTASLEALEAKQVLSDHLRLKN